MRIDLLLTVRCQLLVSPFAVLQVFFEWLRGTLLVVPVVPDGLTQIVEGLLDILNVLPRFADRCLEKPPSTPVGGRISHRGGLLTHLLFDVRQVGKASDRHILDIL